jgi:alkanesulfonate monooxygenase SsuD/methylene tetrahydromethanopterin reductase-like flavin-dependent oxidoreductase (luciferase family)
VKFGIFLLMQSPARRPSIDILQRSMEIARVAESLGFRTVWLAEHHFTNYSHCSQPFVVLGHLAAMTPSLRLGTAIVPITIHHPLFVAEQAATVDTLSGGRLELGIGKGYQKYQFDRLNNEKKADHDAFFNAIELTRVALSGEPFSFNKGGITVPETLIYPQPVQQPLPVWCVVNSKNDAELRDALGLGCHLFTGVLEPISSLTNVRAKLSDFANAQVVRSTRIGTQRPVFVTKSAAEAEDIVEEARWNGRVSVAMRHDIGRIERGVAIVEPFPSEPTTEAVLEDHIVAGTPERCIHQIQRIRDGLGADHFNCSFWFGDMPQHKVLDSMRLFATQVAPAFAS